MDDVQHVLVECNRYNLERLDVMRRYKINRFDVGALTSLLSQPTTEGFSKPNLQTIDFFMSIDERLTAITPDGTGDNGSWKSIPDPSDADQKRRCEAHRTRPRYIDHVGMQITEPRGSMVKRRGGN
ncbi:jg1514 [Pararge aegeria aegeria]|uniref:Jg1514 protein n=1 Tax=Pararge aegeria aegeria TaxID=348720 RepID=A0A8S4RZK8_9NEOP|nr:jg1514 [Pararge aegeria aegeria]